MVDYYTGQRHGHPRHWQVRSVVGKLKAYNDKRQWKTPDMAPSWFRV